MLPEFVDPPQAGFFKYRVLYNQSIQSIEFQPYYLRKIHTLRLISDDTIQYAYKTADRSHLKALFAKRGMDDDILIVKNGLLTDTYYSNIVLENESGLFTPKTPLLPGVRRAHLLAKGQIEEAIIRVEDLPRFQRVHLVNAMLDLDDCVVKVKDIYTG
jgi:4-amino-4-deoxychorismate lyase